MNTLNELASTFTNIIMDTLIVFTYEYTRKFTNILMTALMNTLAKSLVRILNKKF